MKTNIQSSEIQSYSAEKNKDDKMTWLSHNMAAIYFLSTKLPTDCLKLEKKKVTKLVIEIKCGPFFFPNQTGILYH